MSDAIQHRARALRDRYAALLRDVLKALGPDTCGRWLETLEKDFLSKDTTTEDRLESHAMLVGVLTVMCDGIEAEDEEARDE